jgi:hypothetical protein
LLIRVAEFIVGVGLIWVGISSIVAGSKAGRTVINVASASGAGGAGKALRTVT